MTKRLVRINRLGAGELLAALEQAGDVPEEIIESELLATIYKADPSLEDDTGRLVSGRKSSEISLSLYLTEPDSEGISLLGGIRGKEELFPFVLKELKLIGYEVEDDSV